MQVTPPVGCSILTKPRGERTVCPNLGCSVAPARLPCAPCLPHPQNPRAGREKSPPIPLRGPEGKMAKRKGGEQGGASDPALARPRSPRSGPPWATPRNRGPLGVSAIFSYSPGLPPAAALASRFPSGR
ncbi:uncharacterized protein LOC111147921 [Enhydra lutris kenyoni]|uniref:Uncharacterized protein LOC111147921 n=1 Tax=Enhydra lutris kenyoni TaxID=391180 RepID=A0A2Y9JJX6_ENHLU|nr:uncharacterized protein LOC111147921 [Enhydra lutris kenyoni]